MPADTPVDKKGDVDTGRKIRPTATQVILASATLVVAITGLAQVLLPDGIAGLFGDDGSTTTTATASATSTSRNATSTTTPTTTAFESMVGEQVNSEDLESQFGVPVLAINFARQPSFGCGGNMCSYPGFVYQTPPDPVELQTVPTCSSTGYASIDDFEGVGPIDVGRTDHDAVFWTHRWGHVGYEFDIAPGEYFVVLRFAELDVDGRPEKRLFTVAVENMESAVIDIEGTVGLDVAMDLGWQVEIGNGEKLDIRLLPGDADCPSLAAMVVFEDLADR